MKMKSILTLLTIVILGSSCSDDDNPNIITENSRPLVNKIYDYNNNLVAEYFYNENNQLIKRNTTINGFSTEYTLKYENNRILQIDYKDFTYPQFNHSIHVFYNSQGQIIKDEKHQYGNIIETNDYTYYENGNIKDCIRVIEGLNATYTYTYNVKNNIEQVLAHIPEFDEGGTPTGNNIEIVFDYEYDTVSRPDFGIGKIFQIEPLPGFGTEATFEKNISKNNMTKNLNSGTQWVYTYNVRNQVETIETIWNGVETEEPILLRLEYKEVN